MVWTLDGVGKCLWSREVSGSVSAGEFGLAEQIEQDVWSQWQGSWVVLFKDEGGVVFG